MPRFCSSGLPTFESSPQHVSQQAEPSSYRQWMPGVRAQRQSQVSSGICRSNGEARARERRAGDARLHHFWSGGVSPQLFSILAVWQDTLATRLASSTRSSS